MGARVRSSENQDVTKLGRTGILRAPTFIVEHGGHVPAPHRIGTARRGVPTEGESMAPIRLSVVRFPDVDRSPGVGFCLENFSISSGSPGFYFFTGVHIGIPLHALEGAGDGGRGGNFLERRSPREGRRFRFSFSA